MVGDRLAGGLTVRGLNKIQEKNMFRVVISPVRFGRGLFCYSNFIFF